MTNSEALEAIEEIAAYAESTGPMKHFILDSDTILCYSLQHGPQK